MSPTSTPTPTLRGGLIGCGFFAQNHLHSWAALKGTNGEGVELAAVCDRDGAKARAAAERFGVPKSYTDAAEMFAAESLDFVDIVTTMPSHRPLVELAARHHVPCIVQKPFAPTWDDCVAMVETCRASGMPLMVHENFRFQTPLLAVRRVVESGALGQLTWGRVSFRTAYDVYANLPYLAEEEHLVILDLGEVESLYCQSQSIRPGLRGEDAHNLRTYALVMAAYESARTGQAERPVAWGPRARARRRFALE
jgi:predicted dehydrogenase